MIFIFSEKIQNELGSSETRVTTEHRVARAGGAGLN